jgi:hypothetical protein
MSVWTNAIVRPSGDQAGYEVDSRLPGWPPAGLAHRVRYESVRWGQAEDFYQSATGRLSANPLMTYYAFLNLARALLRVLGFAGAAHTPTTTTAPEVAASPA